MRVSICSQRVVRRSRSRLSSLSRCALPPPTACFDGYLAKPYRPRELVSFVEDFLGKGVPDEGSSDDWTARLQQRSWKC